LAGSTRAAGLWRLWFGGKAVLPDMVCLRGPDDTGGIAAFESSARLAVGDEFVDQFEWAVLATLRQGKWDWDKALMKMKALHKFSRKHPQLFSTRTAEDVTRIAEAGALSHLPRRNSRNELVLLMDGERLTEWSRSHSASELLNFVVAYVIELLQDEETQINGVVILQSLARTPSLGVFAAGLRGFGLTNIYKAFGWYSVAPMRVRGIFACREPKYVNVLLAPVTLFMSKKMQMRWGCWGEDCGGMLAAAGLEPECVPALWGGSLEDFDPAWYLRGRESETLPRKAGATPPALHTHSFPRQLSGYAGGRV